MYIKCLLLVLLLLILLYSKNILSYLNTQVYTMKNKTLKIIVFDLDETLGYFTEVSMFWDALEHYYGTNLLPEKFIEMLDIFPEFLRPDILKVLKFIHGRNSPNHKNKILIYTNNQGPKSWVRMISAYMEKKLGYKVFDQIIAAYKVNGKTIEPNRTSHEKSLTDLIRCTQLPASADICFIDDLYHPLMDTDNVYYINIKPYRFSMPYDEMAMRYYDLILRKRSGAIPDRNEFVKTITTFMKQYNYMVLNKSPAETKTDKIVSMKLFSHLEEFLKRDRNMITHKKRIRRAKTMRRGK